MVRSVFVAVAAVADHLPPYFVSSSSIFIRHDRFDIAINLHNLLDRKYFPGGYGGRIRSVDASVRDAF